MVDVPTSPDYFYSHSANISKSTLGDLVNLHLKNAQTDYELTKIFDSTHEFLARRL